MNKRRRILLCVSILFLVLVTAMIWGQSLMSRAASAQESGSFLQNFIWPIEEFLFGRHILTDGIVRKLAHMTEYAVLGVGMSVLLQLLCGRPRTFPSALLRPVSYCGLIALCDETIQSFVPERGPLVTDIWIDCAGATVGVLVGLLIGSLAVRLFVRRRKTPEK